MKLVLILGACIGVSLAAPQPNTIVPVNLVDDIQDFIDLVPIEDLSRIFEQDLDTDGALAFVVSYLQSNNWDALVFEVLLNPAVQDFISWLDDEDVPTTDILVSTYKYIHTFIPGVAPNKSGSLRPLLDEIENVLPFDGLVTLLNDKLQNSQNFQDLYIEISSKKALVEQIWAMDEVQRFAQTLRDLDVEIDETLAIIYQFFGWSQFKVSKIVPATIVGDFEEFIDLLPLDDIGVIVGDHLQTDDALAAVIEYLQTPGWTSMIDSFLERPAPQKVYYWLLDRDVPINVIMYVVRKVIGRTTPGVAADKNASLRPFLDEIEAVLPVDELVTLLNDKLQNSPDFQAFYVEISSEDLYEWLQGVRSVQQIREIEESLRDMGVRVDETLAIIYKFLGWGQPSRY